ncbi:hypothetical protein [Hymenobacter glacieicola]|uniref:Uncharacterized protein n=1 Tax=Hymenobacter glacieicola TaxID=1562124 RepID=A0ABQ1WLV9_9BACT|nr:hypothetical protein [Hymenobacter glacieicola]GGG34332.1 hypothetical protein GCM10011378_08430 [Hymenobacter glacieicola]
MRYLVAALLSLAACKSIQTTINQTGSGHTATTATAQEPEAVVAGPGATVVDAEKPTAPVQLGQGNQATDNTKAGSRGGAAATAPAAVATTTTTKENWLRPLLPWAAGVVVLALLYSLLPLGLNGSGWLLVLLRRGRSREPETG